MFRQLIHKITAPSRLRETEKFLEAWCPPGVDVVNDGHSCWLHYGGMIYSLDYQDVPHPENIPGMTTHLENHKFCLKLVGGVYTRRSLLEAWVRKYLPTAKVIGASAHDIVYPDEERDRPVLKGPHTRFFVTYNNAFILSTHDKLPLPWLTQDVIDRTAQVLGRDPHELE